MGRLPAPIASEPPMEPLPTERTASFDSHPAHVSVDDSPTNAEEGWLGSETSDWDDIAPESSPGFDDIEVTVRPSRLWLVIWLVGFGLLSLGLGYAGFLWWQTQAHKVDVVVEQTDVGQMLYIKPYARTIGMHVRFGERELVLQKNGVRFALDVESMRVGANRVSLLLIDSHGRGRPVSATILVPFRVRFDRSGLRKNPMTLDFVVEALPGSRVEVDGEGLMLDADGHGRKPMMVETASLEQSPYEHIVHYKIDPPEGDSIDGVLRAHIPLTALQLDLPADHAITQEDTVEVVGATHAQAKLTVNGEPVALEEDGRFRKAVTLPNPGTHTIEVVTQEPRRLPRRVLRRVYRVTNVKQEVRRFQADPRVTYRLIAAEPLPYRGQHIRIVGRVFSAHVDNGQSVLQMHARECEKEMCPLWVVLPTVMEVTLGSMVTVLGVVAGEQPFKAPDGKVSKVPRIDALLAVPL